MNYIFIDSFSQLLWFNSRMIFFLETISSDQERSQKGDSGCASEKLGVPHLLSD